MDSLTRGRSTVADSCRALGVDDPDDLLYGVKIAVWVRWFLLITWFVQMNYRLNLSDPNYIQNTLLAALMVAINSYVHYRILTDRTVTWHWMLGLSTLDAVMITAGLIISGGFHNSYFVLYYPALALFAVVFTSFRFSLVWVTVVAVMYAAVSLMVDPGLDFAIVDEKVLFTRIVVMYAVVAAVNLVFRFERIRRREAVERESELQRERIELSQTIHDTIAQSVYVIGIGLETAIKMANTRSGVNFDELIAKLEATHNLSRSTMWELRHPIDAGTIFEGRELGRVLRSHASAFTTITAIPTNLVQSGVEPQLPMITRGVLFSIAHNAMTNAFLHAHAGRITIALGFERDELHMSVSDDGVGLPADYTDRGHGLRNMMSHAQRIGGRMELGPGESGRGTNVTCVIPLDTLSGAP